MNVNKKKDSQRLRKRKQRAIQKTLLKRSKLELKNANNYSSCSSDDEISNMENNEGKL